MSVSICHQSVVHKERKFKRLKLLLSVYSAAVGGVLFADKRRYTFDWVVDGKSIGHSVGAGLVNVG